MTNSFEDLISFSNQTFANDKKLSTMRDFYKDRTVFLTGGTGFIGKLLIAKLLKCEAKEIILLMRAKKGKTIKERLEVLFQEPIFDEIKETDKTYLDKITVVEGDLQKPVKMGLSIDDQSQVIERAEVVIHCAADVRFEESLKEAIETNVRGTKEMLMLARSVKHLNAFIYVSTAFSHCNRTTIGEEFYGSPQDPDTMIQLVSQMTPNDCEFMPYFTEKIIAPWPNTYAYTKVLAEEVMRIYGENMPVAIIRPSIITTTYEDPIPGWTDNIYGFNGVVTGAGLGVLRIFYINNNNHADVVPADIVVNLTLAVAWKTARENHNIVNEEDLSVAASAKTKIKIYNCTNYEDNPLNWGEVKQQTIKAGKLFPLERSLWIVTYNTTHVKLVYEFLKIFYHILPAILFDLFLKLRREKPKVMKLYRKIHQFSGALAFFTTNQWWFESSNSRNLCNELCEDDRKFFPCNIKDIEWDKFFTLFCRGLCLYIVKEPLAGMDKARRRYRRLQVIHYTMLTVVYSALAYTFYAILCAYGLSYSAVRSTVTGLIDGYLVE